MANFLDAADELRKSGKLGDFQSDFDLVFRAISELQAVHPKAPIDLDNIESVFSAFEMGLLINRLPGISAEDISRLPLSIKRVILETLEERVKFTHTQRQVSPDPSYSDFAKLVGHMNRSSGNRCSIISFNYDLALDYSLHFHQSPADYCLTEVQQQRMGTWTPLLKLHGSLNWAMCAKCGQIVPWDFATFFSQFRFNFLEENGKMSLPLGRNLGKSKLKHCELDVEPNPVIVPPTWNKTQYHKILSRIWARAASELSTAENIFVVGYSLPETDLFFRYLFALGSIGQTRIKRFWVYDPDQSVVQHRFETLIGTDTKNKFRFEPVPFHQAVPLIRRALQIQPEGPMVSTV